MPLPDALLDVAFRQAQAHDEVLVDAYQELLAYRLMVSQLFTLWAGERQRRERLETRLKQVMGLEDWHPENASDDG